ncbi:17.3 kDa class I heat shock protein-like [Macadamia integrifolia]|uniref:17.3 kDa class I heat shock protein-like n=1 Tax=Macadamia integrifolia TaxID=60698 RepID=UPI001C4E9ABD|nr:17.3 kDa class I heat shock protein-like [Macadamia integrifolia]
MSLIPSFFSGQRTKIYDPFSTDLWDPFQGFGFGFPSSDLTNVPTTSPEISAFVNPRIDWNETPEAHIIKVDLPGLNKEEVKVEVAEGNIVEISGERRKEQEEKNETWHRMERSYGKFLRRFKLPENVKVGQVKACMENGVLTVIVPKEEVRKPEAKPIEISG